MLSFGGGHPPMDHAPFLLRLWDDEDGVLRVVIALARAGETGAGARTGNAGIDAILDHCRPITPDEDAVYEITSSATSSTRRATSPTAPTTLTRSGRGNT